MVRGRKPKPTAQKILEGNPGKRQLITDAPRPARQIRADDPPEWLDETGRREWLRLASELEDQNLLSNWDFSTFAAYCESVSRVSMAKAHLAKPEDHVYAAPNGYTQVSPWLGILERALRDMVKYGALLGLNPSERSRLSIHKAAKSGLTAAEKAFGLRLPGRGKTEAEIDFGF